MVPENFIRNRRYNIMQYKASQHRHLVSWQRRSGRGWPSGSLLSPLLSWSRRQLTTTSSGDTWCCFPKVPPSSNLPCIHPPSSTWSPWHHLALEERNIWRHWHLCLLHQCQVSGSPWRSNIFPPMVHSDRLSPRVNWMGGFWYLPARPLPGALWQVSSYRSAPSLSNPHLEDCFHLQLPAKQRRPGTLTLAPVNQTLSSSDLQHYPFP